MKMTPAQREAALYRGNLLVSAAAGAGKTSVLTERICRIVLDGVPVNELLVLTFTKAAAAEMKARIEKRLRQYAAGEDLPEGIGALEESKKSFLRGQAMLVGSAYISTFDAFCGRVLRRHGHLIGIPSSFRVIDEMEAFQRKERVKDDLLTACGEEDCPHWKTLLCAFGGEDAAWECVMATVKVMETLPDPAEWLEGAVKAYGDDAAIDAALRMLVRESKQELQANISALVKARDKIPPAYGKMIQMLDGELESMSPVFAAEDRDSYVAALQGIGFVKSFRWPNGTPQEDKKESSDARNTVKDCVKKQVEAFSRTMEEERALMAEAGEVAEALKVLATRFCERYAEEKRRAGCVDYPDMEHFVLELFRRPDVAEEYRAKFRYISVDEYQDTNRVQEALVNAIAGEDNLFFVGDIKQSIYRFRHAEPRLFLEKTRSYSKDGAQGKTIALRENFRSTGEVIGAVNDLFETIMRTGTCDIDYDDSQRLIRGGNADVQGGAELVVIEKNTALPGEGADTAEREADDGDDRGDGDGSDDTAAELEQITEAITEARFVATRIKELMQTVRVTEKDGSTRPLRYRDIAILLRSRKHAADYQTTVASEGIPCYMQAKGGYFESIEVMLTLDILRVIDNRRQDIPLLAVMRSSVGGFDATDLANIRLRKQGKGVLFFDALLATAEEAESVTDGEEPDMLAVRAKAFLAQLEKWRSESRLMPLTQLLPEILTDSGLYAEMGALVDGKRRMANLDALIDAAARFEQGKFYGISAFVRYMESGENGISLSVAQQMEADVVQLLTVHGSKGLEYPVVFYAELGSTFNTKDLSEKVLTVTGVDGIGGIGLKFMRANGVVYETVLWRAIRAKIERDMMAEEMRILYVGMTRARQVLILSGTAKNAQKLVDEAETNPEDYRILHVSNRIGWALMGSRATVGQARVYPRERFMNTVAESCAFPPIPEADATELKAFCAHMDSVPELVTEASVPMKVGVSAVLKREREEVLPEEEDSTERVFRLPAFADEQAEVRALTSAERGTAVHTAAAYLPLGRITREQAEAFLDGLQNKGILSGRQREVIPVNMLVRLSETALWERMAQSGRVEKELPFSLPVKAREVFDTDSDKNVLLQGVIDCCFLEDGAWVLVDYKTDRQKPGMTPEEMASRHSRQMDWYRRALEGLTGMPVKARYIVLLSLGVAVEV